MDLELTPRAVFSVELNQLAQRTLDLDNFLGSNTIASHTMKIYDSDNSDVTSDFSEGSSESTGTLTFGVKGHAEGTYRITFWITCDQTTPDGNAIKFPIEVVLEVTSTATEATSSAAEILESYALISLNDAKVELNIDFSTTDYDMALVHMINDATADIEKHCSQRFASATYTAERHNGTGRKLLYLNHAPIISVSSVTVDGTTVTEASDCEDEDKYWIEPMIKGGKAEGALYLSDTWSIGEQNVVVTYVAGYAEIPYDIRRAAAMLIKEWYNMYKNTEGLKSESIGRYSYTFAVLPPETMAHIEGILENYTWKGYI